MTKPIVAVVVYDQISPFHLSVPCVVFGDAHPGGPVYDLKVCAAVPGPLATTAGFGLTVADSLDTLDTARTIIVPSWRDPAERPPPALLDALQRAHERGARIVGLCLGAYVLAAAGLLDRRRATTHWAYAADFIGRFPSVRLDANVLYVEDDNLMTSAGTAAGLDCCLHIVRQEHGAVAANRLARRLVVPPHRQGGQAQFIEQPVPSTARDSKLSDLLQNVRANLGLRHTVESLAAQATMSRRTFTRHFRQLTGTSVGAWLLSERLSVAQTLLEGSDHSIDRIAEVTGFGSTASLRQLFKRTIGVPPQVWRRTFKG